MRDINKSVEGLRNFLNELGKTDDINPGYIIDRYKSLAKDRKTRRIMEFFFWLRVQFQALFKDFLKEDKHAIYCVGLMLDTWEARASWENYMKNRMGMIAIEVPEELFKKVKQTYKDLDEKQAFVKNLQDELRKRGIPDFLIEETAEQFYKEVFQNERNGTNH